MTSISKQLIKIMDKVFKILVKHNTILIYFQKLIFKTLNHNNNQYLFKINKKNNPIISIKNKIVIFKVFNKIKNQFNNISK